MKRFFSLVFPFALITVALTSCGPQEIVTKEVKVSSIEFTLEKNVAYIDEQVKITNIKVLPDNATNKGIEWKLENSSAGEIHTMGAEPYVVGKAATKTKVVATALDGSNVSKSLDIEFENDYSVTEDEFKNAISFKDVIYLQSSMTAKMDNFLGESVQTVDSEFSPNKYHSITTNTNLGDEFNETYTTIHREKLIDLTKLTKEGSWDNEEWVDSTSEELPTPTNEFSNRITKTLESAGLTFSSFELSDKYYLFEGELMGCPSIMKLKFENKKLVSFYTKNDMSSMSMGTMEDTFAFTYKKADITLPKKLPEPEPFEVTPTEYNNAITFKDIQYLQLVQTKEDITTTTEMAPNICHIIIKENGVLCDEKYIKIDNGKLIGVIRYKSDGIFDKITTDLEDTYMTVEKLGGQLKTTLPRFEDCIYGNKCYVGAVDVDELTHTYTINFVNQKLERYEDQIDKDDEVIENIYYEFAYEEIVPTWPI